MVESSYITELQKLSISQDQRASRVIKVKVFLKQNNEVIKTIITSKEKLAQMSL